jgi:hypothetical protein
MEWLNVNALSSNPSTAKQKRERERDLSVCGFWYLLRVLELTRCPQILRDSCIDCLCEYCGCNMYYCISII